MKIANIFKKKKDDKLELLKKKIEAICENARSHGRFSIFMSYFFQELMNKYDAYEGLKHFYEIVLEYDEKCKIPLDIGLYIDSLAYSPDIHLGVKRTTCYFEDDKSDKLTNIMENGLVNYGHANAVGGSAFDKYAPTLSTAIDPVEGITGYYNLVSNWQNNNVIIILGIPDGIVDKELNMLSEDLYDKQNDFYAIKPEYILGAFIKNENPLFTFKTREEILNKEKVKSA